MEVVWSRREDCVQAIERDCAPYDSEAPQTATTGCACWYRSGRVFEDLDVRNLPLHHKRLRSPLPQMCNIESIFVHKDQDVGTAAPVEYAFLTKGAVRAEINLSSLSPEDRRMLMFLHWPNASLLAVQVDISYAAAQRLRLCGADAKTAHLQSKGIARLVILRLPKPPPPGVLVGTYVRAKGAIYGTNNAGRQWWLHLRAILLHNEWRESFYEQCFFHVEGIFMRCGWLALHGRR